MQYWLYCVNAHSLHPPFSFQLYKQVIRQDKVLPAMAAIEQQRQEWRQSKALVSVSDFGAGSVAGRQSSRSLGQIVRYSSTPARFSRLLYRLIAWQGGGTVLELGTSLGFNSRYMALAADRLVTFEGCPELARKAREIFDAQNNIELIVGNIDERLPQELAKLDTFSLAYLDANHRYTPTLQYFELLLEKANEHSILVFDDIHWSAGMEKAWQEIVQHPSVSLSLDLYEAGIVFLNPRLQKEHYVVEF